MSSTLKEIEISMEAAKEKIQKAEQLNRLCNNPDFKELFLDGFCEEHALGLVSKKVSPNYQDAVNQQYIDGQLTAVGHTKLYMQFVFQEGEMAKNALHSAEEERVRILEEEV